MSVYHFVYAEINVDGKWYNLSPYYKNKDGEYKTHPVFWMQSAFSEVYHELLNYVWMRGIPDDMSESLREHFKEDLDEKYDDLFGKMTWREYYNQSVICVNFANAIADRLKKKKPYKYEGYVSKREWAAFENDEIEEIGEWLTKEEYEDLDPKEKRQWIWRQWNDPWGTNQIYDQLAGKIRILCSLFSDAYESELPTLYNGISDSQVRLFVYRC